MVTGYQHFVDAAQNVVDEARGDNDSPPLNDFCRNPPPLPDLIINRRTGASYTAGPLLGRGGFAWCFLFRCTRTGDSYAGKVVAKSRLTKPSHREKVFREIRIHEALRHEHIVRLHSSFEDDTNVYMLLEYCSNQSMMQLMRERQRLTEAEAVWFFRQLLLAVDYLHSDRRILHRDLKLGNILLTAENTVKLADFGMASALPPRSMRTPPTICGTPNYIAPEILKNEGHSYASESWALGCILYSMLVGRPPFETNSLEETYARIVAGQFTLPAGLGADTVDLIRRLLAREPAQRPNVQQIFRHPFVVGAQVARPRAMQGRNGTGSEEIPTQTPSPSRYTYALSSPPRVGAQPLTTVASLTELPVAARVRVYPLTTASTITSQPMTPRVQRSTPNVNYTSYASPQRAPLARLSSMSPCSSTESSPPTSEERLDTLAPSPCSSATPPPEVFLDAVALKESVKRMCDEVGYWLRVRPVQNAGLARLATTPLFVSRWIDYTNRYGFGCQYSDGSICVVFNDQSRVCLDAERRTYQIRVKSDERLMVCRHRADVPECMQPRVVLVDHFTKYMEEHLCFKGATDDDDVTALEPYVPTLCSWLRTDDCIALLLSNGTIQVNITADHCKLLLSRSTTRLFGARAPPASEFVLTFISEKRVAESFPLSALPALVSYRPEIARTAAVAREMLARFTAAETIVA